MKLSVSLSERQVEAVDRYAAATGLASRSAVIQRAIDLLDNPELDEAYEQAWDEWEASGDAAAWEGTAADGLVDAAG